MIIDWKLKMFPNSYHQVWSCLPTPQNIPPGDSFVWHLTNIENKDGFIDNIYIHFKYDIILAIPSPSI